LCVHESHVEEAALKWFEDLNWILLYELDKRGDIHNPYGDGDTLQILKSSDVSFPRESWL